MEKDFDQWLAALKLDAAREGDRIIASDDVPDFCFDEFWAKGVEPTVAALKQFLRDNEPK